MVLDGELSGGLRAQLRGSATRQAHDHGFGGRVESDRHETSLLELSLAGEGPSTSWVGGVAFQTDRYLSESFAAFDFSYEVPALFGQIDHDLARTVSLAASARWDGHGEYGGQVSPRLSLLYRPGPWTIRASWGRGFYAPTPFVEETEASGLARLEPGLALEAETAETMSVDFGYAAGSFEAGLTVFGSDIDDAIRVDAIAADRIRLVNQTGVTRTRGIETLLRWRRSPYVVTASYLYLDATEPGVGMPGRIPVGLTPRHSAGLVAMWERHDRGRVGLELYYTGTQSLAHDPYRTTSKAYLHVGLLGEIVLGRYRLF